MTDDTLHTPGEKTPSALVEITFDEAVDLLRQTVEAKGRDYVYAQPVVEPSGTTLCAYFDPRTKEPSCLIGHVLAAKGLTFEDLEDEQNPYVHLAPYGGYNVLTDVSSLASKGVLKADLKTLGLLAAAQNEQDQGQTWGDALDEALDQYEKTAQGFRDEGLGVPTDYYL